MANPDTVKWFFWQAHDKKGLLLWHSIMSDGIEPVMHNIVFFPEDNPDNMQYKISKGSPPSTEKLRSTVAFIKSRIHSGTLEFGEDDHVDARNMDDDTRRKYFFAMQAFIRHQEEKHCVRRIRNELNQTPGLRRYAPMLLDIVLGLKSIRKNYPASRSHTYLEIHLLVLIHAIELFEQKLGELWGGENEDEE